MHRLANEVVDTETAQLTLEQLNFNIHGLIPAIIQDEQSKEVLMMAWMNVQSLEKSIETGYVWLWSRKRKCLWKKGETSGNTQEIQSIAYDCDADTLLIRVKQGGDKLACHTGERNCFYRTLYKKEK